MSVYSDTEGYRENCVRSHEFLRRGCSKVPDEFYYAGDLLVSKSGKIKQSEQNDMRGEGGQIENIHSSGQQDCPDVVVRLEEDHEIKETSVRAQGESDNSSLGSFTWAVQKPSALWEGDILASSDEFCGILTDGGDILSAVTGGTVDSLCGSIHRDLHRPDAYFLDNRNAVENDPDKGLLFVIMDLPAQHLEVRWSDKMLPTGLHDAEDISQLFLAELNALGMSYPDVISFGMI